MTTSTSFSSSGPARSSTRWISGERAPISLNTVGTRQARSELILSKSPCRLSSPSMVPATSEAAIPKS